MLKDPPKIERLIDVYTDMNLSIAMDKDPATNFSVTKLIITPPNRYVKWEPFRLWQYTGFTAGNKFRQLQRSYIDQQAYNVSMFRLKRRLEKGKMFNFTFPFMKPWDEEKVKEAERLHNHANGGCLIALSMYFVPRRGGRWTITPYMNWRTCEVTRKFGADLVLMDNLFHDLLDPYDLYNSIDYVCMSWGSYFLWAVVGTVSNYIFPGLRESLPKDHSFTKCWKNFNDRTLENDHLVKDPNDDGYLSYGPMRSTHRTYLMLKENNVPPLIKSVKSRVYTKGAEKSDFPRYSFTDVNMNVNEPPF